LTVTEEVRVRMAYGDVLSEKENEITSSREIMTLAPYFSFARVLGY